MRVLHSPDNRIKHHDKQLSPWERREWYLNRHLALYYCAEAWRCISARASTRRESFLRPLRSDGLLLCPDTDYLVALRSNL